MNDPNPQPPIPNPVADPPWGIRDLLQVALFIFTAVLLSQTVGYLLFRYFSGDPSLGIGGTTEDVRFVLPVQLAAYGLTVGFVFLMIEGKYNRNFWEAIRWRSVGGRAPLFLLAGIALAFASQLVPVLFPSERHLPIEKLFTGPLSGYLLAGFGVGIAPFVEELIFRGVVYPVLEVRWGLEAAVLSTAALFAAIHAPQLGGGLPQVGYIFLVGVALSYARGRTGNLVPPYLIHVSYNATLFTALYLSSEGFRKFP